MKMTFSICSLVALLAMASPSMGQGSDNGATGQVSVTTAATLIAAARPGGPRVGRVSITIINRTGSDQLCLGFTNAVTVTTGQCLAAVAGVAITMSTTAAIYGIVATTAQTVSFSELY